MDAATRRYHRNKALGVCRFCGKESGGASRCPTCKEKLKTWQQQRYAKRKAAGICVQCQQPTSDKTECEKCRQANIEWTRQRAGRLRDEVLKVYGEACKCCGEKVKEFLQIDHIDGGGNEHRREIGVGQLYRWLKKKGWPAEFQTLCANCNMAKHLYGVCPHQR